ncbi:MAG: hypothetical protein IIA83_05220 [Thaumarchaeota archaeon]|nr:hypothetical protein [Nitrososphaerota archaeon]
MRQKSVQENAKEVTTDFGVRKVNTQNFSKTVVLPKQALSNCGCNLDEDIKVTVQLVQRGSEKFIKLIPVCDETMEKGK